jgi:hypothetical protein
VSKTIKNITGRALSLSLAIVTCLTLLSRATESAVFFFLLYPGAALSLLITGGHGGTQFENRTALAAGFVVNTFVYAALFAALLALPSRGRDKGTF